ncbi:MAG: hypothetical protein FJ130_11355 [Deltaproteobacteria bacterium]|nr:hypothetical protein [Deltaproteobacteria bacterium]
MTYHEDDEELDHGIKADQKYAQILIKMNDLSISEREAEELIESLGLQIVSKNRLSTYWVLFKLNVRDMRDAALKLTEHGFIVKGINALP